MARNWVAVIGVVPVLWFASFAIAAEPAAEETTQQPDGCKTASTVGAQRCPEKSDAVRLVGHEPSLLGWTYDESGHGYMDFLLSVKFALFPAWIEKGLSPNSHAYLAFTGRFGQYFDRESSPVISKRFNPELFYRHTLQRDAYLDVGYGHESNGQGINSPASYQQAQASLEKPEYADDYISRGWDYVRLTVRSPQYTGFRKSDYVQAYLTGKRFLDNGVFQGQPEEYNTWENDPEGKPRDEVDGVSALVKYVYDTGDADTILLSAWKFTLIYTTGYREIFRYNSVRFEVGVKILQLPLVFWTSHGYNSDLVRYYKDIHAAGVAIEIGAF